MNYRNLVTSISFFVCIGNTALSQDQKSILASGGAATGTGGSVSYSIGQVAYTSAKSSTGSASQGVQNISLLSTLPITFLTFSGECRENSVKLNWQTASEIDNNFFSIEKSYDAINWMSIATIKGAKTSNTAHTYEYTDLLRNTTTTYYRLKQVDLNGNFNYSQIVYVLNCGNKTSAITLYPNPASDGVYLNVTQFLGLKYSLYDISGKLIKEASLAGNTNFIELSKLAKAIYIIKVINGNTHVQTFRIFKN